MRDSPRLVGLCFSFFLLFSSYFAAQNQVTPTLGDFGSLSLALLYTTLAVVACAAPAGFRRIQRLCAPHDMPERLRAETFALAFSAFLYAPFPLACANESMHWAQLLASAVLGLGAGLLWVAQGSVLTACTTPANRGRWSGVFWASFMAGNAVGNFSSSAIVAHTSVSTMFVVLSGVAALSSLSFFVLVRPRRPSASTVSLEGGREILLPPRPTEPASLCTDLRTLLSVLRHRATLSLLPILLFIGAENAFWGGEFPGLVSQLGGADSVGLVIGTLALSDMLCSVAAGLLVDQGAPTLALLGGLLAFGGSLALVCLDLVPRIQHGSTADGSRLPASIFIAAALMGAGDAAANTVVLSRLGTLSDEAGVLPRETAFQYFQVANVAMTALGFVYAPLTPLDPALGTVQYQPALLIALGLAGGLGFCAVPAPRTAARLPTLQNVGS